jgi:hypothetical protein
MSERGEDAFYIALEELDRREALHRNDVRQCFQVCREACRRLLSMGRVGWRTDRLPVETHLPPEMYVATTKLTLNGNVGTVQNPLLPAGLRVLIISHCDSLTALLLCVPLHF